MPAYKDLVQLILDGQLVDASTIDTPLAALGNNINYVKETLELALAGETTILHERTLATTVQTGQAVYFNPRTQQFEQALAAVDTDPLTGYQVTTLSTQVWGIVLRKLSADQGDILVQGAADVDLTQATSGDIVSGLYYLSGTSPGMLEAQVPPVSVPVALVGRQGSTPGVYEVFMRTSVRDVLESHKHYRFALRPHPAGQTNAPSPGDRHTVGTPDAAVEGWLPADDASFGGKAPAGAVFGYNIAASALRTLWPPLPIQSAYIEFNRGEEAVLMGVGVPLGQHELCTINADGIWWMSDCYGDAPWPTDFDSDREDAVSLSESLADTLVPPECPRQLHMQLTLYFIKPTFYNAISCVLSLTAAANSGLIITCAGSETPASTGHLNIDLDLNLLTGRTDLPGYLAFKNLNTTTRKFELGPVVESLKAGSDNVQISGGVSLTGGYRAGPLTIAVNENLDGSEIQVETVRLASAREANPQGLIALAFEAGRQSEFYGRLSLRSFPDLPDGTRIKFRFLLGGQVAGALAADILTMTYRRVQKPSALKTPRVMPTTDDEVTMNCEATFTGPYQYMLLESDPVAVATGDVIMFMLGRNVGKLVSAYDAYSGDLYIIRKVGVLVIPGVN